MKSSFRKYIEALGPMNNLMPNPTGITNNQQQIQDPKLKQAIATAKQLVSKPSAMGQNPADQTKLQATKQILTTAQASKDKTDMMNMIKNLDQQQRPTF